jgi:CNP1-like family
LRRCAVLLLAALAACGSPPIEKSDWERQHEGRLQPAEESVVLPAYPKEPQLVEFFVAATSEFRFFVDSASIAVGRDGVVRYTLVARSAAGVENVSYEGMRCTTGEVRIYALGRGGAWTGKPGEWRTMQSRSVQRWHNALHREYFCPQKESIVSPQEGIDALRRGGHPMSRDMSGDIPRGR